MRLTCPNCGAQYEVPAEVIPSEGRDVQCSNCGDTWFQPHPDAQQATEQPDTQQPEPKPDDLRAAVTGQESSQPEPEPEFDDQDDIYDDQQDDLTYDDDLPPTPREDHSKGVEPSVANILKEEAAREAELRANEAENIESQPELGLDATSGDEPSRRAKEARDRMAIMKGEDPQKTDASVDGSTRRDLLPDIEEINSTLRSGSDQVDAATPTTAVAPGPARRNRGGGFMRGLTVAILFGALLALLYLNAPQIAQSVPQADPMLSAFVALVDQARVWLDMQMSSLSAQ